MGIRPAWATTLRGCQPAEYSSTSCLKWQVDARRVDTPSSGASIRLFGLAPPQVVGILIAVLPSVGLRSISGEGEEVMPIVGSPQTGGRLLPGKACVFSDGGALTRQQRACHVWESRTVIRVAAGPANFVETPGTL